MEIPVEVQCGCQLHFSIHVNRLPELQDYWSTDPMLSNTFISSWITRKNGTDNSTLPLRDEPGYHQLQKVMPIIMAMKEKFEGNYSPRIQNSIDEAVIPFKG